MNVVVPISIISLFFAILRSVGKLRRGLEYCFVLLMIVGAIHYDYGNDYANYLNMFYESGNVTLSWQGLTKYFRDPGWTALCILFQPLGFFGMVIILNIIQNFIYYHIIKNYVPIQWQWLAVFIYVFSTSFYLLNFSMMRQGLAIALLFQALFFIIEKKYILSAILVVGTSLIHGTSTIAVPFILSVFYVKKSRNLLIVYLAFFFILLVSYEQFYTLLSQLTYGDSLSEYSEMYMDGQGIQLGIGFAVDMVTIITLLYVALVQKSSTFLETRILTYLIVSYLLLPFQMMNQMIGRIGYYFSVTSIIVVPLLYRYLRRDMKIILLSLFISISLYRYWLFFTTGTFVKSYSQPFQSIFSVPWQ